MPDTIRLEPLLSEEVSEFLPAPADERRLPSNHQTPILQSQNFSHFDMPTNMQHTTLDPTFQQQTALQDILKQTIDTMYDKHVRTVLAEVCRRVPAAEATAISLICPQIVQQPGPSLPTPDLNHYQTNRETSLAGKRQRLATCRRCGVGYDRSVNNMDNRQCLYHKGTTRVCSSTTVADTLPRFTRQDQP